MKILLSFLAVFSMISAFCQDTLELSFSAVDSATYVQLDSIKVMNRTQGGDTLLYWPDTVLSIPTYYVGIPGSSGAASGFQVYPNYPNPATDQTSISLYVPENDRVSLSVTDILGRVMLQSDRVLDKGMHTFLFIPGGGNLYFFNARWQGNSSSIKILRVGSNSGGRCSLEYAGSKDTSPQLKTLGLIQEFFYSPGDELLYIGFADTLQSGMLDTPDENQTYILQFATNIPCPGSPTVEYDGQLYNTIQIFSQCWLGENLNVGEMILVDIDPSDNGVIEKYCYNDEPDSCTKYGGLYRWDEMMQYTTQQGAQGICPPDWHLPTDEEWKVLEGAVDSQYGIGDNTWDIWGWRGTDQGTTLKATFGWYGNGNGTDLFGFSGLPGGRSYLHGYFTQVGDYGNWWTSTEIDDFEGWDRTLPWNYPDVGRGMPDKVAGFSVRCIRDY